MIKNYKNISKIVFKFLTFLIILIPFLVIISCNNTPKKPMGVWGDAKFIQKYDNLSYQDEADNAQLINDVNLKIEPTNSMYQVLVYAFADGNNDGIGDFIGLKNKLPYLQKLGVDKLYLSPIHPASSYHGYDVIDYTAVAPELGGQKAFDEFLKKAHQMGFKVYLDMVFNHTSYEHPWFQKALKGDPKYQKYYIFKKNNPAIGDTHKDNHNFGKQFLNIDWKKDSNLEYNSKFWAGMPDLNLNNKNVIKELKNVQRYWTKKGVDGYRYDAFKEWFSSPGNKKTNYTESKIFSQLREASQQGMKEAQRHPEHTFMMGEWWGNPVDAKEYYHYNDNGHEKLALDSCYDGEHWKKGWQSGNTISVKDVKKIINTGLSVNKFHEWTPFLDNHDVPRWINHYRQTLDLAARKVFNAKEKLKINAINLLKSMFFQMLVRPATPIIFYGDELGYHSGEKNGDAGRREAIRWKDPKYNVDFYEKRSGLKTAHILTNFSNDRDFADNQINNPDSIAGIISETNSLKRTYPFLLSRQSNSIESANNYLADPKVDLAKSGDLLFIRKGSTKEIMFVYSWGNKHKYILNNRFIKKQPKILFGENTKLEQNVLTVNPMGFSAILLQ